MFSVCGGSVESLPTVGLLYSTTGRSESRQLAESSHSTHTQQNVNTSFIMSKKLEKCLWRSHNEAGVRTVNVYT